MAHTHSPPGSPQRRSQVSVSAEMIASPSSISSIIGYRGHIFALRWFSPPRVNGCFQNHWHWPHQGYLNWMLTRVSDTCLAWNGHYFIQWSHASGASRNFYDTISALQMRKLVIWECKWCVQGVGNPVLLGPLPLCFGIVTYSIKIGPQAPDSQFLTYLSYPTSQSTLILLLLLLNNWYLCTYGLTFRYILIGREHLELGQLWQDNFSEKEEELGHSGYCGLLFL